MHKNKIDNSFKNPKKVLELIREACNETKKDHTIKAINSEDGNIIDEKNSTLIAHTFNNHFATTGSNFANKIVDDIDKHVKST